MTGHALALKASGRPRRTSHTSVHEVLRSASQPLDESTRAAMEPRFGADFSQVRVHADDAAAASARAVGAAAYTVGEHIVFGAGQYEPRRGDRQQILAHELAHTIQQRPDRGPTSDTLETTSPGDRSEREADRAAAAIANGEAFTPMAVSGRRIARQPAGPPAPGTGSATPTKKKIVVNVVTLSGATRSVSGALTYANTKVYNQADVEIAKGKEVTLDEKASKGILGNDLILEEYKSPSTPTDEEKALFKQHQTKGAITMYFVKAQSDGSTGEAFWPALGHGFIGFVNNNSSNDITFSHELAHVLLDDGGHAVPDDTYLMFAAKNDKKYKLTPEQIATIKASTFAT